MNGWHWSDIEYFVAEGTVKRAKQPCCIQNIYPLSCRFFLMGKFEVDEADSLVPEALDTWPCVHDTIVDEKATFLNSQDQVAGVQNMY